MKKEIIICIVIVIIIIIANVYTEKYTSESVEAISSGLMDLRENVVSLESVDKDRCLDNTRKIKESWNDVYNNLAYYIEHDELEKVENSLIAVKSYLDAEEYGECVSKIDEADFVLRHIQRKYQVTLKNIF